MFHTTVSSECQTKQSPNLETSLHSEGLRITNSLPSPSPFNGPFHCLSTLRDGHTVPGEITEPIRGVSVQMVVANLLFTLHPAWSHSTTVWTEMESSHNPTPTHTHTHTHTPSILFKQFVHCAACGSCCRTKSKHRWMECHIDVGCGCDRIVIASLKYLIYLASSTIILITILGGGRFIN